MASNHEEGEDRGAEERHRHPEPEPSAWAGLQRSFPADAGQKPGRGRGLVLNSSEEPPHPLGLLHGLAGLQTEELAGGVRERRQHPWDRVRQGEGGNDQELQQETAGAGRHDGDHQGGGEEEVGGGQEWAPGSEGGNQDQDFRGQQHHEDPARL